MWASSMRLKLMIITALLVAITTSVTGTFGKDRDPKLFITDAIKSNLSEIALGKLAAKNLLPRLSGHMARPWQRTTLKRTMKHLPLPLNLT